MPHDAFVVFADILGFADLVEQEGADLASMSPVFDDGDDHDTPLARTLLEYRFKSFHKCLHTTRAGVQKRGGTAIVFSDSVFFAVDELDGALELARGLLYNLVYSGVPVRMGIAPGSFRALRFTSDTSLPHAVHMAQFLGTGVVRAWKAEHCGLPGLRAFIHPDLTYRLDQVRHRVVPVSQAPTAALRLPVLFEINYLDPSPQYSGPHYDDVLIFDSVSEMHAEASNQFHYHYEATFHALNVMRAQLGSEPYPADKYSNRDQYQAEHGITPEPYDSSRLYPARTPRPLAQ